MKIEELFEALQGKSLEDQTDMVLDFFMLGDKSGDAVDDMIKIYQEIDFKFDENIDRDKNFAQRRRSTCMAIILESFFGFNDEIDQESFFKLLKGLHCKDIDWGADEVSSFKLRAAYEYINKKPIMHIEHLTEIMTRMIREEGCEADAVMSNCLRIYFANHFVNAQEVKRFLSNNMRDCAFIADHILQSLSVVSDEMFYAVRSVYSLGAASFTCSVLRNISYIDLDKDLYIQIWRDFKKERRSTMRSGYESRALEQDPTSFSDADFMYSLKSFINKRNVVIEASWLLEKVVPLFDVRAGAPVNFAIGASDYKTSVITTFLSLPTIGSMNSEELTELLRNCGSSHIDLEPAVASALYACFNNSIIEGGAIGEAIKAAYPDLKNRERIVDGLLNHVLQNESSAIDQREEAAIQIIAASIDVDALEDFLAKFTKSGARGASESVIKHHFDSLRGARPDEERPKEDVALVGVGRLEPKIDELQKE